MKRQEKALRAKLRLQQGEDDDGDEEPDDEEDDGLWGGKKRAYYGEAGQEEARTCTPCKDYTSLRWLACVCAGACLHSHKRHRDVHTTLLMYNKVPSGLTSALNVPLSVPALSFVG